MQTKNPIGRLLKIACITLFAIILPGYILSQEITISGTDGEEGSTSGKFTFTPASAFTSDGTITVSFTSGTATETVDYSVVSKTINYLTGETEVSLDVNIIDDSDVEGQESIELTIQSTTGDATIKSSPGNKQLINITDNDKSVISIDATTQAEEDNTNGL
ncbi:Calx-beta domain-containing protein, partial [Carboxylicivirga marina]